VEDTTSTTCGLWHAAECSRLNLPLVSCRALHSGLALSFRAPCE
jgi:hypothetical protein